MAILGSAGSLLLMLRVAHSVCDNTSPALGGSGIDPVQPSEFRESSRSTHEILQEREDLSPSARATGCRRKTAVVAGSSPSWSVAVTMCSTGSSEGAHDLALEVVGWFTRERFPYTTGQPRSGPDLLTRPRNPG
jgi:hypothetical protein